MFKIIYLISGLVLCVTLWFALGLDSKADERFMKELLKQYYKKEYFKNDK